MPSSVVSVTSPSPVPAGSAGRTAAADVPGSAVGDAGGALDELHAASATATIEPRRTVRPPIALTVPSYGAGVHRPPPPVRSRSLIDRSYGAGVHRPPPPVRSRSLIDRSYGAGVHRPPQRARSRSLIDRSCG